MVAFIVLPAAVGLAILGLVLGLQNPDATLPLLGISALVACIGLGFLAASRMAVRWYREDADHPAKRM